MDFSVNLIGILFLVLISWTSAAIREASDLDFDAYSDPDPITAETTIVKACNDDLPRMSPEEPLYFEQISGVWYAVRIGPPWAEMGMGADVMDCVTESYWKTGESPKNEFSYVWRYRTNGTYEYESYQGTARVKQAGTAKKIDPLIIFSGVEGTPDLPCTVIGTDKGASWLVWAACFEIKGKTRPIWSIMSRTPTMDPKLEQTLVEYVETHGGIPRAQLGGIGHTNCHAFEV